MRIQKSWLVLVGLAGVAAMVWIGPLADDKPRPEPESAASVVAVGDGPWKVEGRVIRKARVPALGVAVSIGPAPKSQKQIESGSASTGKGGCFAFTGLPDGAMARISVDEPRSALLLLDIDPEHDRSLSTKPGDRHVVDLGEIELLDPSSLVVRILGPAGEPRDDGKARVKSRKSLQEPWRDIVRSRAPRSLRHAEPSRPMPRGNSSCAVFLGAATT